MSARPSKHIRAKRVDVVFCDDHHELWVQFLDVVVTVPIDKQSAAELVDASLPRTARNAS